MLLSILIPVFNERTVVERSLSLVLAARVFSGRTRTFLTASGGLCLAGFLGPVSGHLRLQFLAIAGYGFVLPIACALVGLHFRREISRES